MKLLPLAITLLTAGLIFGIYLGNPAPDPAGDIVEYYGATESLLRHGSLRLTDEDRSALSESLHPEYFTNPGYYFTGTDGFRYPMHFVGYSFLLTPVRFLLEHIGLQPFLVFPLVNTLIMTTTIVYAIHRFFHAAHKQFLLFLLLVSSPLLSFLLWPGPDILYLCLFFISLCFYMERKWITAAIFAALASWHSQPLMIMTAGILIISAYEQYSMAKKNIGNYAVSVLAIIGLAAVPYLYNYSHFATWTPWTILQDFWTKTYGFGLHNIRAIKLFEQLFDLNVGVFWYAPVLTVFGLWQIYKNGTKNAAALWLIALMILTLLAYQTNPAWHYGTSGYGPSRHAIVVIPYFILVALYSRINATRTAILAALIVFTQMPILSMNSLLYPVFSNTLSHAPQATFILDRFPALYNPTPEIFVDRTNHTDLDHPTSAIYKTNGVCKKAYVLTMDIDWVIKNCGALPKNQQATIQHTANEGFYVTYP